MARKVNGGAVSAKAREIQAALKDISRDLEVFAEGRGTQERYWTIQTALWECSDKIQALNPNPPKRTVEAEVVSDEEAKQLTARPTLALTHQSLFRE